MFSRPPARSVTIPTVGERVTYRVDLAYDGSRFDGFQRQGDERRTVESVLVGALRHFVPELTKVAVGGRTDKGVHARGQVVSFYCRREIPGDDIRLHIEGAGRGDLAVLGVRRVPRVFHASFSAVARAYTYRVSARDLDIPRLDAMLGQLVGRRCFHAFSRRTPEGQSTVRRLLSARVFRDGPESARFELVGDGFLRHQVRVLVATALREMRNRAPAEVLLEMSRRGERAKTAPPAEAGGLWLMSVSYV